MTDRETAVIYVLFLLENKEKLKGYSVVEKLFKDKKINIDKGFYSQMLISFDLYDRIKEIYQFKIKSFIQSLVPKLQRDEDNNFLGFPERHIFIEFYLSLKRLILSLTNNDHKRKVTFIPLLPDNEIYRRRAIKYVDEHLQYSLNDLKLEDFKSCISSNSIFVSEVIKCMIATDIHAKSVYYKGEDLRWRWNDPEKVRHDDEIRYREDTQFKYSSRRLFEYEMKLFEDKEEDMDIRIVEYSLLSTEDVLRLDYLISDPPIRFATCLTSSIGFLGMIYLSFKKKEEINSSELYGIRTTIFGLHNNERGIAKDLLNGIFQYSKSINIQEVRIIKTPLGPMEDILKSMGFIPDKDKRYTKKVDIYLEPNTVKIIDMGCKDKILKDDEFYKIEEE